MRLQLKNVRLSFADIFDAKPFEPGATPKFGACLLIAKNDKQIAAIQQAINEAAVEKWGAKAKTHLAGLVGNPNKYCFIDGDTKTYDGYAGHMYISAKNEKRPLVMDKDKSTLTKADGRPYSGCYVNAIIEIWAQDNNYGKGIRATLHGVQFYRDGDAFAAGTPATPDDFDDLSEGADAEELA